MLVRTRPYRPAFAFDRSFDRTFDQLTSSFFTNVKRTPVVDASWQDGNLTLAVDLPGTPAEHVAVDVAGRTLTIKVGDEHTSWERSLRLGAALDAEQVAATYVDGRLTVTVAAAAQPEARTIEISTSAPAAIEASTEAPEGQPENGTSESA
jgi:HSP20 family molecular chaperone IbpA